MRKITFLFSLFLILSMPMRGQSGSDFNIPIPDIKVGDSKYNDLRYIESRPDPDDMGCIFGIILDMEQPVNLVMDIESQLHSLISAVTFPSDKPKAMAVQMRALFFGLGEGDKNGRGVCNLRMTLYEMDGDDRYYFLNTIDTLLVDDRKKIKESTGQAIVNFIVTNLSYYAEEGEAALSLTEVMDIDFYEKNSIPLYTEESLPDGIYANYKSFKNLTPDISSDIQATKTDEGQIKRIKVPNKEKQGKYKTLKNKEIYAVVIGGIPYISFEGDLYKSYKKDDDWRFIITRKITGSGFSLNVGVGTRGSRGGAAVGFGIPIGSKTEDIEMFIDHLNGDFHWGGVVQK